MPCNDFPADPIIGPGAPPNAPGLFGAADGGGPMGATPCLVEPQDGALFPNNWLRPRFRVKSSGSTRHLYEFRLHATTEAHDLLVYTTSLSWTMPKDMWLAVTSHVIDEPITMSVRSAEFDGQKLTTTPATGAIGTFTIAPVVAEGTLVYRTSRGKVLKGFTVGDESVGVVLQPSQTSGRCLGCHASTPDGLFIGHEVSDDPGFGIPSRVEFHSGNGMARACAFRHRRRSHAPGPQRSAHAELHTGVLGARQSPRVLDVPRRARLDRSRGDVDGAGSRMGDLRPRGGREAPVLVRREPRRATHRVRVGGDDALRNGDARRGRPPRDPVRRARGGTSVPLEGANNPSLSEYYPAFSPDDRFIAFARVPANETTYNDPLAEVGIIPSAGGSAIRLDANDPPACSGAISPGVTNSWPKWAPQQWTVGDKTYYWIIFSSRRTESQAPQLYVSGVVVNGASVATHAAIYLWNQPENEGNHTPSWDLLKIPPPPK